jgi:hypothetical protein
MNRSNLRLLGVAAALVLLVLLFANPFTDRVREDNPERVGLFAGQPGAVDRITVASPGAELILLARTAEGWRVGEPDGFPADTAAVGALLDAVTGARAGGAVSRNPERRAEFEVDEGSGVRVTLGAGDEILGDFLVGKSGSDFTAGYVRPAGEDPVYLVRGLNRNVVQRRQGYRDRTLLSFAPGEVVGLAWAAADSSWTLDRSDSGWVVTSPDGESGMADDTQADLVLRVASSLTAEGFFAGRADTLDAGFADPAHVLTARFSDGTSRTVVFGRLNTAGQRFAQRADRDAVYLFGDWNLNHLRRPAAALRVARVTLEGAGG